MKQAGRIGLTMNTTHDQNTGGNGPDNTKAPEKTAKSSSATQAGLRAGTQANPKTAAHKGSATPIRDNGGEDGGRKGGGRVMVWAVLALIFAGGAVVASWSVLGPWAETKIVALRSAVGLAPRPTQVLAPSEPRAMREPASMPAPAPKGETTPSVPAAVATPTPEPAPEPAPAATPARDGALIQRLDDLDRRLAALSVPGGGGEAGSLAAVETLTRTVAALESDVRALSGRLDALKAEQSQMRARADDATASAQVLVLAVTQLRARLLGDAPFDAELSALERIAAKDKVVAHAVARLRPHAKAGVPTEGALIARFEKTARAIMNARVGKGESALGWLGALKEGLGGLVTIRRTDPADITDDTERAVAVAEAALELGDLDRAVGALDGLRGAPAEAAAPWLGDARARVDAEAALEELYSHALAVLSAAGGGTGGGS